MNTRQSLFIGHYVASLNATQAALDAGYSPKTAYSQGQRLLKNVEVQEALVIRKAALAERAEITALDVLKMLQREAAAGDLDVPNSARIRAQELIGKHIGMFSDTFTRQNTGTAVPQINIQFGVKVDNNIGEAEHGTD